MTDGVGTAGADEPTIPAGVVTFLFTDIEGSTRRWEEDPTAMRAALAEHDDLLLGLIKKYNGYFYQHTGDGVLAAFHTAQEGVDMAIEAQRLLGLPVRMGLGSGEIMPEGIDYFGPILNRTARVMSAGHGGQILVTASTAELLTNHELIDFGVRQLKDLPEGMHIFQVNADGLETSFPPLKTLDIVAGNLPATMTSFIGRSSEIAELAGLVRTHRMVTLVGVGGVGKTRLSLQVAAQVSFDFPAGAWFVELASVIDPTAVPDAVANAMGITPQPGHTVAESIAQAIQGLPMLLVLDNCEHVLDAAADLADLLLGRSDKLVVLATSREALAIGAEHTWPVPPLDFSTGADSTAVSLFAERALAASRSFSLSDPAEVEAVTEICQRLDGIALAIELAAARMVSMTAQEVRDRLDDRFRLLSSRNRGDKRHQTLLSTVQWSYDLLDVDEQKLLGSASVFLDGFDLASIASVHRTLDEYALLDVLESLVRKSLASAEQVDGRTRYTMLETIRQFGHAQLSAAGQMDELRTRHAQHFGSEIMTWWNVWDQPDQKQSLDWVDTEHANLRAAFRWSVEQDDLDTAAAIAAHAAIIEWPIQRFEPVAWAEEIIPALVEAETPQLPRVYVAASLCLYAGRPDTGVLYAQEAAALENDPHYDPFIDGWSGIQEALAHLFAGRVERRVEISTELAQRDGFARVVGMCSLTWALPAVGRADEAALIADETLVLAREFGNPFWIGWAYGGVGRAFAEAEPVRALNALREGLQYADDNRLGFWEANLAQDAAKLEASHGEFDDAMALFARSIAAFHRAGNVVFLAASLASLAVSFERFDKPAIAATIYGSSTRQASINLVPNLDEAVARMRETLGADAFDQCVATGEAFTLGGTVEFANEQIAQARSSQHATSA